MPFVLELEVKVYFNTPQGHKSYGMRGNVPCEALQGGFATVPDGSCKKLPKPGPGDGVQAHLGIKGVPPRMAALCSQPHSQTTARDKL